VSNKKGNAALARHKASDGIISAKGPNVKLNQTGLVQPSPKTIIDSDGYKPLERNHVLASCALAMPRPSVHQFAPPRERIAAPVGLFGLVANDVRQRMFGKLAGKMRLVACPIAERTSKAVRRVGRIDPRLRLTAGSSWGAASTRTLAIGGTLSSRMRGIDGK
jgi:hypothetical protein